ncbi:MAG TPA: cysteine hydrolase [Alphaproteobacteria bacterium]|nr:cysteine hydrolase [Alphaproteobacteria bacterium]
MTAARSDTPKTLLQMAGADLDPSTLSESVLVVIDAQNEYRSGGIPLPGVDAAVGEIAALLRRARAAGTPVVHVQHRGRPGGAFDVEAERGRIMDEVAPSAGEPVVLKPLPNAFAGTDLGERLAATGRKQLIVTGFMTHMCVSSTARAALDHGYRVTIPAAACATRDLPAPDGGIVKAADLHRAALAGLADRFAIVARDAAAVPD